MHPLILTPTAQVNSVAGLVVNFVHRSEFLFSEMPVIAILALMLTACGEDTSQLGEATYRSNENVVRCEAGAKQGKAGIANNETAANGIKYNVRTPLNYEATQAHPLLMVYAPAKKDHFETEELTGLTRKATSNGFVVAYADHRALSPSDSIELSTIPDAVAEKWCIDQKRVFMTGHSDGGTVSMAIAFMAGTKHIPAAIAPSAVGIRGADLADRKCPEPIPVMIMHSANDKLFPGFGMETVLWWASCNQCDINSTEKLDNGCLSYSACADEAQVWYCEGSGSHAEWPGMNGPIMDFFTQSDRKGLNHDSKS